VPAQFIELKLAGQHWTCWGMLIHPLDDIKPEVAKVLLANISPCFMRIDLGPDPSPYDGMLEDMRSTGTPAPVRKRLQGVT